MEIVTTRLTPLFHSIDSTTPRIWVLKGKLLRVSETTLHDGRLFGRTSGGLALLSGRVDPPAWARERPPQRELEPPEPRQTRGDSKTQEKEPWREVRIVRKNVQNVGIYKVVGNEDSLQEYAGNCAAWDTLDGDLSIQHNDWRALYTQFQGEHTLGTVPYRWNSYERCSLLKVCIESIDVIIVTGSIFHDGNVSGGEKAAVVKKEMGIDPEKPLMHALGEMGVCAMVLETEDEWELIIPHNLMPRLTFSEQRCIYFRKHPDYPLTDAFSVDGQSFQDFDAHFDLSLMPDIPLNWADA